MSHRYKIVGSTISDYDLNITFPRDINNSDYVSFLKTIHDEGTDLIVGMYTDEIVLEGEEMVLQPVPDWVQEDYSLI